MLGNFRHCNLSVDLEICISQTLQIIIINASLSFIFTNDFDNSDEENYSSSDIDDDDINEEKRILEACNANDSSNIYISKDRLGVRFLRIQPELGDFLSVTYRDDKVDLPDSLKIMIRLMSFSLQKLFKTLYHTLTLMQSAKETYFSI